MSDNLDVSRPDPATDLVGALRYVMDGLDDLKRDRAARKHNASEAARELGYNARYFHGRPWRIPSFGLHGLMHPLSVWKAWDERPEAERRAEWDAMPVAERTKARRAV